MRDSNFLEQIDLRTNEQNMLMGLKYKPIGGSRFIDIIVRKDNTGALRFSDATSKVRVQEAIREFVERVKTLDEAFSATPSGITEEIANREVFGSENGTKLSDEQIWERNEIRDETRKGVFESTEQKMRDNRDMILDEFQRETGFGYPDTADGTKFADHVAFITDPISNMDWYEDEGWSISGRRPNEEIHERELDIIKNARKDVLQREKMAISSNQIKAYNDLKVYLQWKEETLKNYFDKPLKDPKIVEQYKKVMRSKAGRMVLRRAVD